MAIVLVERVQSPGADLVSLPRDKIFEPAFALETIHRFQMIAIPPWRVHPGFEYRISQRNAHSVFLMEETIARPGRRVHFVFRTAQLLRRFDDQ